MTRSSKSSFLTEKGKDKWSELTREDMNEYYRIYYHSHKERYKKYRDPKFCELCQRNYKDTWAHTNSNIHKLAVDVAQRVSELAINVAGQTLGGSVSG